MQVLISYKKLNMYHLIYIVLSISVCLGGVVNSTYAQPKLKIDCESDFIDIDNLNNIYVVNQSELSKYNSSGQLLFTYSNRINGEISSIDVTNPLRVLVFCRESNTITFLNRQLSEITQTIDIYDINGVEADNACASAQSGFWIYSSINQSVMLFNNQLTKLQESENLSYWLHADNIKQIKEQNQKLYIVLPERVVVLDLFGLYLTTIHLTDAKNIKLGKDKISYQKGNKLFYYDLVLKTDVEIPIEYDEYIFR